MLFVTQPVVVDELIRDRNDLFPRAEILLHEQYFGISVFFVKIEKRLRVCRPEAVNALVLVADHEQVPAAFRKDRDHGMLDPRRVLCLVDADIPEAVLKCLPDLR